ncbi:MAG: hypothetical protein A2Y12_09425 [Planctomycetes bacterium GWF2_42_9]|nr:MAG: hypothetical protein A2Y12_09425 [Planctomycetes bacterium GWF2_42_9]
MKKLVYVAICVFMSNIVLANSFPTYSVGVAPEAEKFGALWINMDPHPHHTNPPGVPVGGFLRTETNLSEDFICNIGDVYASTGWWDEGFLNIGVAKFQLPTEISSSDLVTSASIKGYCYVNPTTVYFKVQRYINNNTTVLGPNDNPNTASLVDVGIFQVDSGGQNWAWFSFDVTAGVAADIAAGKTYSYYVITAVYDALGTPMDNDEEDGDPTYYYMAVAKGWSNVSRPHLEIEYIDMPENCSDVIEGSFGLTGDMNVDCVVDMKDLKITADEWLSCTTPGGVGCVTGSQIEPTGTIARGTAVVDGDLSEWDVAEWIPIDVNIYGNTSDVTSAKMALRWNENTDKIYAAVIVKDTVQFFTDEYEDWSNSDRLEIFSQGSGAGGQYDTSHSDIAQQYFLGINTAGNGYWACWWPGDPLIDTNLEAAVSINGQDMIYELGVQMFDNFGGRGYGETVVSQLITGKHVRFDIVIDTRSGFDIEQFGVLATTEAQNRYDNADNILEYELVESIPCGGWGYQNGDLNADCLVNFKDLAMVASDWMVCNDPLIESCIENW